MLVISSCLINLLFNTGDVYYKTPRLKTYSYTLKKHLYSFLNHAEVQFFHPPML